LESFDQILKSFPNSEIFYRIRSDVHEIGPQLDRALVQKGLVLLDSGQYEDPARYSEWMLKNKPSPQSMAIRGSALLGLGRYEVALDCFDKAVSTSPQSVTALMLRSITLCKIGNYRDAIQYLEKARHGESFETLKNIRSLNRFMLNQVQHVLDNIDAETNLENKDLNLLILKREFKIIVEM